MSTVLCETDKVQLTQISANKECDAMLRLAVTQVPMFGEGFAELTKTEAAALSEALHDWAIAPDKKNPSGDDG